MGSSLREPRGLVLDRYVLYDELASGGMATVHLGRLLGAAGFARTVAIKRLHPQYAKNPEFVAMFTDEARIAARIRHPNVVTTLDVLTQDRELFVVMEYVHGEPLSRLIATSSRKKRKIDPRIVASIVSGALHGLHAAHEATDERGAPLCVVHRDVSPQNILVGADGVARVLDFGIARAAGRAHVTTDGTIKGKLAYMPPEQLRGDELDRRADVYAAGVVLWEALTCRRLFAGASEDLALSRLFESVVDPPSKRAPGLSSAFDELTLRALSREPADRFATAREMAVALEGLGEMATQSEVGAWVRELEGEALLERERTIAFIEQDAQAVEELVRESFDVVDPPTQTTRVGMPAAPASIPPLERSTVVMDRAALAAAAGRAMPYAPPLRVERSTLVMPTVAMAPPRPAVTKARGRAAIVGVVLLGLFGGASLAVQRALATASASVPASAPESGSVTESASGSESESESGSESGSGSGSESESASGSASASARASGSASVSASAPTPAPRAAVIKPRPTPVKPRVAADSCDPPFVIDAQGHKRYKRECL